MCVCVCVAILTLAHTLETLLKDFSLKRENHYAIGRNSSIYYNCSFPQKIYGFTKTHLTVTLPLSLVFLVSMSLEWARRFVLLFLKSHSYCRPWQAPYHRHIMTHSDAFCRLLKKSAWELSWRSECSSLPLRSRLLIDGDGARSIRVFLTCRSPCSGAS